MAQEDKGLVLRGFLLVALISCIVAFVLTLLFWRNEPPVVQEHAPPENVVPLAALPTLAPFPSNVSWVALVEVAENSPSAPGFDVRYNAASTMARRGDVETPWPLLLEMLDEKLQLRNSRERQKDGKFLYDPLTARTKTTNALKAIAAWHEKHKNDAHHEISSGLRDIYTRVDELSASGQGPIKEQAEKTRATFFR
ncbi:MAG TPA: hypothetical protein VFE62_19125 [Gemmataceae bacterium]|nr:hypothetical protein [Gemmataceae bacterium]